MDCHRDRTSEGVKGIIQTMINKKITIIGTGHIGRALFLGLVRGKAVSARNFTLTSRSLDKIRDLEKEYGAKITADNKKAVINADMVFIAVRPRDVKNIITEIKEPLRADTLIISVAACVTLDMIEQSLGQNRKIVRIIPNIPVAYGTGVVGWFCDAQFSIADRGLVKNLFKPLGTVIECGSDAALEKLSMIAGCGIGYTAFFMKNLEDVARSFGFSREEASNMVLATFSGTLEHLNNSQQNFAELITAVATPGGITEEVLSSLEAGKFSDLFLKSVEKGYSKVNKVAEEIKRSQ
jgi:pyrroline-5-carboxylate reductase